MTLKEFKVQLALGTADKFAVACNPNTSKEVLEYLSKDENYLVSRYLKESNKE